MLNRQKTHHTIYIKPDNRIRNNPEILIDTPLIINPFTN